MEFNLLSIKPVWHCGLQQQRDSSWRLAAFSLCIVLIIQQSVTISLPQPTPSVAAATMATSSLELISSPQFNDWAASSSSLPSASELAIERETTVLTPGQMVINAIPKEDRVAFFTYQLAVGLHATDFMRNETESLRNLEDIIGYAEEQMAHLKDVPIYENFPTDLLRWLMEKFNLLPEELYNHLRSRTVILCTEDGICYTPNDVVCFCCPF